MLACFANILYVKEGIRVSPTDLKSTRKESVLSEEILEIIQKYQKYFEEIENTVEFIDDIRHGYGIYNYVREYALNNGKLHKKTVEIEGKLVEIVDYYEANNPDEYVMIIIDHISLISAEKRNGQQLTLHESISVLSSDYLLKLRNRFNYIPVVIQQQSSAQEGIENKKANRLKPTMDGLGDNKLTGRDANVMLGLFSPYRHEISNYFNYDITKFKDNIRFLEIMGSRDGGGGTICPLYFDGAVNYFKELPLPDDPKMAEVYKLLNYVQK
jgi:hypothetical protein